MIKSYQYISIPRTGSQSIRSALGIDGSTNHIAITKIQHDFDFSFTFLRNPIDRLISWFYWHKKAYPNQYRDTYDTDFESWVRGGFPVHNIKQWNGIGLKNPLNQWEYISDERGKIVVDFIGDFANLQKDFGRVCHILGLNKINLPYIGVSESEYEISSEALGIIKRKFYEDIQLYESITAKAS